MVVNPEISALTALVLTIGAEMIHSRRITNIAILSFGPSSLPSSWARIAPATRCMAVALAMWGLTTLLTIEPKIHKAKAVDADEIRHIVIVLDVSPSMKIKDAGEDGTRTRRKRAFELMESFFKRVRVEQMRLSLIAVYNGAKPVVVDTKDAEVVRNFLDSMDMYTAFEAGKTHLFDGLDLATEISSQWRQDSTTIVLLSDGDTVPSVGIPKMPRSVNGILVIGVGNPIKGTFLDGQNSKQDASTLRQIALRLNGTYHDGNVKHIPSETISSLVSVEEKSALEKMTRREYALVAIGTSALILAALPFILNFFGTKWRVGIHSKLQSNK
ncbi:MAG: VWA domain-containing protein [Verrucomicrobiota bacterium]|nr:VWA domain-containing protein [Verrucomicrobiota bacterium]